MLIKVKKQRPAVAMIELIFAIVIMGIVLMSAPMLINQASKSGYTSSQQESIAAVASHMALVLSRHWDETNTQSSDRAKVLATTTDAGLVNLLPLNTRAGVPSSGDGHRTAMTTSGGTAIGNASTTASFAQNDEDTAPYTFDDIDDYHNTTVELSIVADRYDAGDYIDDALSIATTLQYIDANKDGNGNDVFYNADVNTMTFHRPFNNALGAGTSNIKQINVRFLKNKDTHSDAPRELDKDISFNAFSCNIGSYDFESRAF